MVLLPSSNGLFYNTTESAAANTATVQITTKTTTPPTSKVPETVTTRETANDATNTAPLKTFSFDVTATLSPSLTLTNRLYANMSTLISLKIAQPALAPLTVTLSTALETQA